MNDLRAKESYRVQLLKVVHLLGPANLFVWNSALMNAGQAAGLSESILCSIASSSPNLEKNYDARFSDVAPERRPPLKGRAKPSDAKRVASQAPQVPQSVERASSAQPMSLAQATPATIHEDIRRLKLTHAVVNFCLTSALYSSHALSNCRVSSHPTSALTCSPDLSRLLLFSLSTSALTCSPALLIESVTSSSTSALVLSPALSDVSVASPTLPFCPVLSYSTSALTCSPALLNLLISSLLAQALVSSSALPDFIVFLRSTLSAPAVSLSPAMSNPPSGLTSAQFYSPTLSKPCNVRSSLCSLQGSSSSLQQVTFSTVATVGLKVLSCLVNCDLVNPKFLVYVKTECPVSKILLETFRSDQAAVSVASVDLRCVFAVSAASVDLRCISAVSAASVDLRCVSAVSAASVDLRCVSAVSATSVGLSGVSAVSAESVGLGGVSAASVGLSGVSVASVGPSDVSAKSVDLSGVSAASAAPAASVGHSDVPAASVGLGVVSVASVGLSGVSAASAASADLSGVSASSAASVDLSGASAASAESVDLDSAFAALVSAASDFTLVRGCSVASMAVFAHFLNGVCSNLFSVQFLLPPVVEVSISIGRISSHLKLSLIFDRVDMRVFETTGSVLKDVLLGQRCGASFFSSFSDCSKLAFLSGYLPRCMLHVKFSVSSSVVPLPTVFDPGGSVLPYSSSFVFDPGGSNVSFVLTRKSAVQDFFRKIVCAALSLAFAVAANSDSFVINRLLALFCLPQCALGQNIFKLMDSSSSASSAPDPDHLLSWCLALVGSSTVSQYSPCVLLSRFPVTEIRRL